jgi:hypothetical protein
MPEHKTKYEVLREVKGGERRMFSTYNYKKASDYFNKHPTAFGIQKSQDGIRTGLIQPNIPSQVTIKGKVYKRSMVGGHRKDTAMKITKDMNKAGYESFPRKTKHGWQVFSHFE